MKVKIQLLSFLVFFFPALCSFKMGRLNMFSAKVFGLTQARQRQESLLFTKNTHGTPWPPRSGLGAAVEPIGAGMPVLVPALPAVCQSC